MPLLSIIGFSGLGLVPTLAVLVVFESLRRAGNYALSRPARETLFTVVSREDKFKAKPFIDTFVYRSGDVLAAWTFTALGWLLGLAGIAFLTAPLAGLWLGFGLWLGRRQGQIVRGERPVVDTEVTATEG